MRKRAALVSTLLALALLQVDVEAREETTSGALAPPVGQSQTSVLNKINRPRVALVLGGGGARGAAHVGVLKVLQREGITVDCIVGTSIGAIVGGLYSAGVPLPAIEEGFSDGSLMRAFMTVPLNLRLAAAPLLLIARTVHHPYDGLYKGNKFRKYLGKLLVGYPNQIENLKIPFAAVALNVVDGKAYKLSKGDLGYVMQASSAVPGLRKPVLIDNNLYVDGGVVANLPVRQARELGADIVIAVDVDERIEQVPLDTFRRVGSIAERILLLQLANNDAAQTAVADVVIHPQVDGIGLISTKVSDTRRGLKEGELAAQEALPQIKAKLAKAQGLSLRASD